MGRGVRLETRLLCDFLTARLTEDLGRIWDRPGAAAQLAVVDELLLDLRAGRLPERRELRILLYGYGRHPDYDPAWSAFLSP